MPRALGLLLLMSSLPLVASQGRRLDVGIAFRLNEKYDSSVQHLVKGIQIAKDRFESTHPGVTIRLVNYPYDASVASQNRAAARMIADGVHAVVGGEMSEEAIVLAESTAGHDIVLMTPTATSPAVTKGHPFAFRGCFGDQEVADRLAEFMVAELHPKAVGVLHNVSSPYSDFLSAELVTRLGQLPAAPKTVIDAKILRHTMDLRPVVKQFESARVEAIVMFVHDVELLTYLAQSSPGRQAVFIGSDGWGSNQFVLEHIARAIGPEKSFVGYRNSYWHEEEKTPESESFRHAYVARFGQAPNAWSAIAYDSAWVLFTAMSEASTVSGKEIRKQLENIHLGRLVTTRSFSFQPSHSPLRDLFIYRVSRDGIRFLKTIPAVKWEAR